MLTSHVPSLEGDGQQLTLCVQEKNNEMEKE